jgi:hypothetical protein
MLEVMKTFNRVSKKRQRESEAKWEKVSRFVSVVKRY